MVPPPRLSCAPDTKFEISTRSTFWLSRYFRLNSVWKASVSGEQLDECQHRATSSIVMCSWYKIRNFNEIDILALEIFPIEFRAKSFCIRRTARRVSISCHLLDFLMLLIQDSKFQRERFSGCRGISAWISCKNSVYQEHSGKLCRSTSSSLMCFWCKMCIFSEIYLLGLGMFPCIYFFVSHLSPKYCWPDVCVLPLSRSLYFPVNDANFLRGVFPLLNFRYCKFFGYRLYFNNFFYRNFLSLLYSILFQIYFNSNISGKFFCVFVMLEYWRITPKL